MASPSATNVASPAQYDAIFAVGSGCCFGKRKLGEVFPAWRVRGGAVSNGLRRWNRLVVEWDCQFSGLLMKV